MVEELITTDGKAPELHLASYMKTDSKCITKLNTNNKTIISLDANRPERW